MEMEGTKEVDAEESRVAGPAKTRRGRHAVGPECGVECTLHEEYPANKRGVPVRRRGAQQVARCGIQISHELVQQALHPHAAE